jgi:drug/metabolite transporter (DMT)-like permease
LRPRTTTPPAILASVSVATASSRVQGAAERRPLALICVGILLFSVGPVMFQSADSSGQVIAFWRLLFGVGILGGATLAYVVVTGRRPTRAGWLWSIRCGVVFVANQLFFLAALNATSVVDVTLMQALQPLLVAALAAPMFGERPGAQFRVWSLVAIAGAAVVALFGSSGPEGDPVGMGCAIAAICLFAVYFVWSKQARDHIDTWPFLFGVSATGLVVVTLLFPFTGDAPGNVTSDDIWLALAIAALPGAIGHFVSTWPLRWVPANVPPLLQLAIPFLASTLAWLILDEAIELGHVVGGAITILGVAGAIRSPAGRRLVAREEVVLSTQAAE